MPATTSAGPTVDADAPASRWLDEAARLGETGAHGEALLMLDHAIACHPRDARLHAARGWAIENIEPLRLDDAHAAYRAALALDPDEPWAGLGLATVLERLGDAARAEALLRELARRVAPRVEDAPELLELLGWCLYRIDRLDEAVDVFRRGLRLDADWVAVRFDLGLALLQRGDVEAAAAEFEAALRSLARRPAAARAAALRLALEDLDDASLRRPAAAPALPPAAARPRALLVAALAHDEAV